jgi:GR25 family glycosyltransferase involved in LPS biosynthesis
MINDFFKKTYCINLDRRPDRWLTSSELFKKNNIQVERFSAKDGNEINLPSPYKFELAGTISHLNVIRKAKDLGLDNVLIFEDDVEFNDSIQEQFNEKIKLVPNDWDMIYFGGNHVKSPQQVNDFVYKIYWTYAIQMYAVNSKFFDELINFLDDKIIKILNNEHTLQPSVAADYFMAQLHESKNCYVIRPHFTWQKEGFSDIQETITNYIFLKD